MFWPKSLLVCGFGLNGGRWGSALCGMGPTRQADLELTADRSRAVDDEEMPG